MLQRLRSSSALFVSVLAITVGHAGIAFAAPFPGTLSWELRSDVPGGVAGAAGGVIGNRLYVSHGFRGADSVTLDVYDVIADSWSSGPDATVARSVLAGA